MLYEFLLPLTRYESGFNIIRYISFRAAGAADEIAMSASCSGSFATMPRI